MIPLGVLSHWGKSIQQNRNKTKGLKMKKNSVFSLVDVRQRQTVQYTECTPCDIHEHVQHKFALSDHGQQISGVRYSK